MRQAQVIKNLYILKVRPHYAARHTAAKCGKAAR